MKGSLTSSINLDIYETIDTPRHRCCEPRSISDSLVDIEKLGYHQLFSRTQSAVSEAMESSSLACYGKKEEASGYCCRNGIG